MGSVNLVFHNNFINDTRALTRAPRAVNTYDDGYPSGGNYWSDYNGTDLLSGADQNETGSDGIGDTGYAIDANNIDHYPLTGLFSDFEATSEHRIQMVCNSSISDFQFNGAAIRFNVSGEKGSTGFCRICIPKALMNETYKVYVNDTEIPYTLFTFSNSTCNYLCFNYTHSTEQVTIIGEFPSFLMMPTFFMATLLAVVVYRKKIVKTPEGCNFRY
jgi:hypothetical protein